jgi:hypothetical protein
MQLLATRAQSEGSLELWDDAIRDDLAIYDLAVHKQGPLSFFAVATLSDAALAQCRAQRYRDGESNARKAHESSAKAFGLRAALTEAAADTLATCLIGLGKLDQAGTLLQQIDVSAVAQLTGDPNWGAGVSLEQAEIAYRRHDYDAARGYIQTITPIFTRKDAEPYQKRTFETLKAALDRRLSRISDPRPRMPLYGEEGPKNPTAEELAAFRLAATCAVWARIICLPSGEHCPKGLICLGCVHAHPKKSAVPIFRRMLASHEPSLGSARSQRTCWPDRSTRDGDRQDQGSIAERRR